MLTILEKFLTRYEFKYLRMDGSVPINQRDKLINEFANVIFNIIEFKMI